MNMTDIEPNRNERKIPGNFDPFRDVPAGYFENLPDKLMMRISAMESTNIRVRRIKFLSGIAAAVLILAGIGFVLLMGRKDSADLVITENIVLDHSPMPITYPEASDTETHVIPDTGNARQHSMNKYAEQEHNNLEMIENIPIEVVIEYLVETEELEF